jgi:hypothetical protein
MSEADILRALLRRPVGRGAEGTWVEKKRRGRER